MMVQYIMNKKIVIISSVLIYLVSAYFSFAFFSKTQEEGFKSPFVLYAPPKDTALNQVSSDEPKTEECPLNGEMLAKSQKKAWEKRRPLGIMVENHLDARPQSGLSSADVVYEAVAEGGITRFLAIFYCKDSSYVGPVRSARVYFIDALSEYGQYPLYGHVGGANTDGPADALGAINKLKWNLYNDLNQFAVPFPYYWRDYERLPGRITEHTVYSATQKLWQYAKEKRELSDVDADGERWDTDFVSWKFKKDDPIKTTPLHIISFDFWNDKTDYSVTWEYVTATNTFKRAHGAQPHIDKNTNNQIESHTVVIVFAQESSVHDGYPGGHMLYKTIGQGKAIVFQDGRAIQAQWEKSDAFQRMQFTDSAGKTISFNRGQIFVEIVPKGNTVTY